MDQITMERLLRLIYSNLSEWISIIDPLLMTTFLIPQPKAQLFQNTGYFFVG